MLIYFSASQDRSEHEVERMKSCLILCYGHVAAQAPHELVLAKVESDILRCMFQCFNTKVGGHCSCLCGPVTQLQTLNLFHFLLFRFWE